MQKEKITPEQGGEQATVRRQMRVRGSTNPDLPGNPLPPSATQLLQVLTAYSSGRPAVVPPVQPTAAVGPPVAPQAPGDVETARQQLDAVSRQLAAHLDDQWRQYLALPPASLIRRAVSSPLASSRSTQATRAPSAASVRQMPRPMQPPAPVTSATLSFNRFMRSSPR